MAIKKSKTDQRRAQIQRRIVAAERELAATNDAIGPVQEKYERLYSEQQTLGNYLLSLPSSGGDARTKRKEEKATRKYQRVLKLTLALNKTWDGLLNKVQRIEEKLESLDENLAALDQRNPRRRRSLSNPGRQHLAGASAKVQRLYEKVLSSIKNRGKYMGRQKQVAARIARKKSNPRRNKTTIKAKRVYVLSNRTRSRRRPNPGSPEEIKYYRELRKKTKASLDKLQAEWKELARKMEKEDQRDLTGDALKASQTRFRGWRDRMYEIEPQIGALRREYEDYLNKIDQLKGRAVENPRRRRNAFGLDFFKRSRAAGRSQKEQLRSVNSLISNLKKRIAKTKDGSTKSALRSQMIELQGTKYDLEQAIRQTERAKAVERRGRRRTNPTARQKVRATVEKFGGKRSKSKTVPVSAPIGTPKTVGKLGRIRKIRLKNGTDYDFTGTTAPYLATDSKNKLYAVGGKYRMNPPGSDQGVIERIVYEASKPHLGAPETSRYYHDFGEDDGRMPRLRIDDEGLMHIVGGNYSLESDGIHN